jgi:hypothetical protein
VNPPVPGQLDQKGLSLVPVAGITARSASFHDGIIHPGSEEDDAGESSRGPSHIRGHCSQVGVPAGGWVLS